MSVFRVKGSPYYQFDFQIDHYRFYGSTKKRNEREAQAVEAEKRAEATSLIKEAALAGRRPGSLPGQDRRQHRAQPAARGTDAP